jgi:hypothetical protein
VDQSHLIANGNVPAGKSFMNDASEPNRGRNSETSERYFVALGAAAADLWSNLPQELQHTLFERAVVRGHKGERDESLREQLAKFLHDHHARTLTR